MNTTNRRQDRINEITRILTELRPDIGFGFIPEHAPEKLFVTGERDVVRVAVAQLGLTVAGPAFGRDDVTSHLLNKSGEVVGTVYCADESADVTLDLYKPQATSGFAQREINACERFIAFAMETAKLTRKQAERALEVYKKNAVIKIDRVVGQFTFVHGGFADASVLTRAARDWK